MSEKVFLFSKFLGLSPKERGLLALGCAGAFFKSFHFVWLNGLIFNSYYKAFGVGDLSFLFLISALCMIISGLAVYKVVSGVSSLGSRLVFSCFLGQAALCAGLCFSPEFSRVMVVCLLPFIVFVQAVFYNAVFRFVWKDFESKKFFCLVCMDILGIIAGGQLLMLLKIYTLKGLIAGCAVSLFAAAWVIQRLEREPKVVSQRPALGFAEHLEKEEKGAAYLFNLLLFFKAAFGGFIFFRFYELFYFFCLEKDLSFVWLMGAVSSVLGGVLFFILFFFFKKGRRIRSVAGETGYFLAAVFFGLSCFRDSFAGALLAAKTFLVLQYFWEGFYESALLLAVRLKRKAASFLRQKVLVEPAGMTVAMLAVFLFFGRYLLFLGIFSGLMIIFLIFQTSRKYAFLMKKKLSAFSLRDNFFPVILENGLFEFSCRQLESADAEKAAYFLKVLENSRHPLFKEKVSQLLLSPLPSVRLKALQTVERCSLYSKKEQVVEMVENDSAALVRREALSTLISLTEEEEISLLAEKYLPQEEMKSGVLQGFLKKDTDKAAQALYFLNEMAFSPNAAQRFEACRIMCSGPSKQGYPLARKLCQDGDLSVRKKAFELAGKMRSVRLVPFLIEALQDEDTKSAAFDALLKAGPTAYAPVKSALKDSRFSFDVKRELVLFLALSDKDACADVFSHLLPLVSLKVQREIYIQMRKIEKECGVALPRAPLLKSIFQNLKGLEFIFIQKMELAERRNSFSKEEAEAFSLQLKEFKKILRDNVLDGFYFMYSLKVFRRAVKALMEEKKEEFAASFGIMEDVLPEKYVRQALPLLKESFSPDRDG